VSAYVGGGGVCGHVGAGRGNEEGGKHESAARSHTAHTTRAHTHTVPYLDILEVHEDQDILHRHHGLEDVLGLGDPVVEGALGQLDDAALGGTEGGGEVKLRSLVGDVAVLGVEGVDDLLEGGGRTRDGLAPILGLQVDEVHQVLGVAGLGDGEEEVAPILRDGGPAHVVGVGRVLPDQHVLALWRADAVVVDLGVAVGLGLRPRLGARRRLHLAGLGVAVVEEALVVLGPRDPGELGPHQGLPLPGHGQALPGRPHLAHVDGDPVAARVGEGIGKEAPILGEGGGVEGHGAIGAQGVGVEEDGGAVTLCQRGHAVQDGLLLEARVVVVVVGRAPLHGAAGALVIIQLGQPGLELGAQGAGGDVGGEEGILPLDKGLSLGRVRILQVAVGVGEGVAAVQHLHLPLVPPGGRVRKGRGAGRRAHGAGGRVGGGGGGGGVDGPGPGSGCGMCWPGREGCYCCSRL
jgi:hypothetical protein